MKPTTDRDYDRQILNMTVDEENVLTEEKWTSYNEAIWRKRETSDRVFEQIRHYLLTRSKRDYIDLSTSEIIINSFLSWPDNVKTTVTDLIAYDVSVPTIEAYLGLLFKLQEYSIRNNMDCNFLDIPVKDMCMTLALNNSETMHRNSPHSISSFCDFFGRDPLIYRNTYSMMQFIYGEVRVIEVSTEWIKNTTSKELSDFIGLVDNWDEYKTYPVDWSVNLLRENADA